MDKFYIPISSLNFNNIIATESISPKSFYQNRKFGYKRFYNVKPNPFEDILLGYSKIPNFHIDDTDLDDYPLVIEVSTDLLPQNEYIKEQTNDIAIYKIFNTIYFNPTKTKFYFFSEKEKDICLMKVAPSIETKLMPIYQNNIKIINKNNTFLWNENILKDIADTQKYTTDTDNDLYINRLKGFYYCYHLGILLTKIKNKNLVKEYPKNKITELLQVAENNGLSNNLIYETEKLLKNFKNAYEKHKNFSNSFIVDINNYRITNFRDNIFDEENNEIYRNIINDLIAYLIYDTQSFLDKKVDLVLKMGENFKEIFNEEWNGSEKQNYINSLLDNLEEYKPFNLQDTKNEILKAISLFVFKGDDIEKLYNALQKETIKDYRFAFGLWGALFGFSEIPKTMSNILFEEKIKDMINIQDFLKDMYKKIHNFDIQGDIEIEFIQEKIISKNIKYQNDNKQYPKCPECGGDTHIQEKNGKKFYACNNYSKSCKKGCWIDYEETQNSSWRTKSRNWACGNKGNQLIKGDVLDKIYEYVERNSQNIIEKKVKIKDIVTYLNNLKIKVPNTRKKFTNKEVKLLIQNDVRFEVIGKSPEFLQLRGITK